MIIILIKIFSAQNIDKTEPIIPQLFKIIEPEENYKKV